MKHSLFLGRSERKDILEKSSSGGIITTTLVYLFKQKKIDAALVSSWNNKKTELKGKIIKNEREALSCAQSKYLKSDCTQEIIEIINSEKKFAIVGTPCHIKMAQKLIETKGIPKQNYYLLGLFCNHPITKEGLYFIFDKYHIDKKEVKEIKFRGRKTWDSQLRIKLKNRKTILIPTTDTWGGLWGAGFFTPLSCLGCPFYLPLEADLMVGDAWETSFRKKTALIIPNTDKAISLLKNLEKEKILWLKKSSYDPFQRAHQRNVIFKCLRAAVYQKNKKQVPYNWLDWFLAHLFIFNAAISKNKKLWPLINFFSPFSRYLGILIAAYYRRKTFSPTKNFLHLPRTFKD
ncbi:Coenzyme F420 hydrogenase/dehydrogenase, beta subunit C-terminal domain [bacterium]|nr:Coenzyme F420 hydrogenase/dehydrogenase, beta subunit C-terminal domain [bacterium]